MMAVAVENICHGTLPGNNRAREGHDTGIKGNLPARGDEPLQAPTVPKSMTKRRRPPHDVDGPHTEFLSCKKRRLRRDLITSRLSRPYSMPATHIIHREASAAGDQRFMKLAAVARSKKLNAVVVPTPEDYGTRMPSSTRKHQGPVVPLNQTGSHHMQASSEIVRRAAILNRIRLKGRDDRRKSVSEGGPPCVMMSSRNAAICSQEVSSCTRETTAAETESNTSPSTAAADVLHLGRVSPRLRPVRSPELPASRGTQITKPMDEDQLDDDSLSFPNNSCLFADEAADYSLGEDVYADFSVIFGGGGSEDEGDDPVGDAEEQPLAATEHFEDYMDDLDGIPRAVR